MKNLPLTLLITLTSSLQPLVAMPAVTPPVSVAAAQQITDADLAKLKLEDTLTDAQFDNFKPEGRWIGPTWWANRMADWGVNGDDRDSILCSPNRPFLGWRVAVDMTRNIDLTQGDLDLSVDLNLVPKGDDNSRLAPDALAGVLLGSGHSMPNYKSRALIFDFATKKGGKKAYPAVPGSGYAIGVSGDGFLRVIDLDHGKVLSALDLKPAIKGEFGPPRGTLRITSKKKTDELTAMTLTLTEPGAKTSTTITIPTERMKGGIGLLSHPGAKPLKGTGKNIRTAESLFSNYQVKSGAPRVNSQAVGPIVLAQYTINRGVLKLTAQCMPNAGKEGTLSFYRDGKWQVAGKAKVTKIDEMLSFRVENWNSKESVAYRVSLPLNGSEKPATYTGKIAAEPTSGKVRLAALGCVIHRPWGQVRNWNEVNYYPHQDIIDRTLEQKPDLVFFYGDQMYEGTPSYVDRANIHEDYLYKWLFHCYAFNEVVRDVPSATIPDDHDVYQGNHWGAGGRKAPDGNWNNGGYKFPGAFIAQVHRTQTTHLPDCPEPNSMEQNIPAYFCDWNWGGMSFAIVGDRLFKSGPANNGLPSSKTKRPDHYNNPEFDTAGLDLPHLELLGKPQEKFLTKWAQDWSENAQMKAVLSQSPFGNFASHHAGSYLIADLDSNGWPQSGRNRAVSTMRAARAVHIAGDQHLSTLVQHGVENHDDAVFGFTAPAVSNAYARAYYPALKTNYYRSPVPKPEQYLGKRLDGFKNKVTFHAVANPNTDPNGPYHQDLQSNLGYQVPGFGIVDFDTVKRTITFNSHPRSGVIAKRLPTGQYPGWPKTVKQTDNEGRKVVGLLANVTVTDTEKPVVTVHTADGKLSWSQRMNSNKFSIPAYADGEQTVTISSNGKSHTLKVAPADPDEELPLTEIELK